MTGVENVGYLYGKRFGSKINVSHSEGDGVGASRETGCGGNDPHGGHGYVCEGVRLCFRVRRVSHWMVEIKVLFFRWLSHFLKLV
jgi:hypothetical protein